jgi:hypothetical protein
MKNIIKFAILLMVLGLTASCSKDYLDVNVDPNNPTKVTPDLALPVAQLYTARIVQGDRRLNHLGNMLMYNWSQSDGYAWYPDEFKYLVTSSFYQGVFNDSYSTALKQYGVLDNLESKYDYYKAISLIMKSYHYQLLVDCYGDIPFNEALGRSLNPTPKYDGAQKIYDSLIVHLTRAIDIIDNAVDQKAPGADDAMFGGDMTKWKQFANTVKLRILVRESDLAAKAAYVQTEMNAIIAEGSGFMEEDVKVNPGFITKEEGKQNVIWDFLGEDASGSQTMTSKATCATDYILSYLAFTNDTLRMSKLYEKPKTGHLGVKQGELDYDTPVLDQFMPELVSNIGPGILQSADQGAVIFSLAENYFNQAEAANKSLIVVTDEGKELYEKGITASFEYLGLTADEAKLYYSQIKELVGWSSSANKLEAIITQKWIAVNGITAEQSWFDYSRTGFPSPGFGVPRFPAGALADFGPGLPLSALATTADRPVRLFYVAGELSSNGKNVPAQPNAFTAKVFWAN